MFIRYYFGTFFRKRACYVYYKLYDCQYEQIREGRTFITNRNMYFIGTVNRKTWVFNVCSRALGWLLRDSTREIFMWLSKNQPLTRFRCPSNSIWIIICRKYKCWKFVNYLEIVSNFTYEYFTIMWIQSIANFLRVPNLQSSFVPRN